jgi:RNA polymerase sigma factor (sigma-70 family)
VPPSRLDRILAGPLAVHRHDPRSDADLLARFRADGDEAAFTALVFRHTPAVRAACRGWLRAAADVDDAAQAAFLALAQRAGGIRDGQAVGRWLYCVAGRAARRLRRQLDRYGPLPADPPARTAEPPDELTELVAAAVARLPEKYRLPVQLCYAAGLTTAEAARRLGCPKGTVLTRLAWARRRLQKSLTGRGVAPAALALPAAGAAAAGWACSTARAAAARLAGRSPAAAGASPRAVLLAEGVVRAMTWEKVRYAAAAALVAVGLVGFGVGQWSAASAEPTGGATGAAAGQLIGKDADPPAARAGKPDDARPAAGRRREVTIRLPAGTFVKDVEVAPYGSARITWTYEEDRVLGTIEASVMGFEAELATEAEYSLSSTGAIYGVVTSVRLNHLKLPDGEEFAELKPFAGLWPAVEPLVNEMTTDLPFSYRFHVSGDRLTIGNFRILLAGPNPLGKLGVVALDSDGAGAVLAAFQLVGTALEGTYVSAEAKEERKPAPGRRPLFRKPAGRPAGRAGP